MAQQVSNTIGFLVGTAIGLLIILEKTRCLRFIAEVTTGIISGYCGWILIEQWYYIHRPFGIKWLGLTEVMVAIISFFIVTGILYCMYRPDLPDIKKVGKMIKRNVLCKFLLELL